MIEMLIYALLAIGIIFNAIGALALHRFIDPYTRLHGSTLCTTFGSIFIVLAVVIYSITTGSIQMALHAVFALAFIMVTSATGSHAIARASYLAGIKPKKVSVDKLAKVSK